jgi:hypothetical protein
MSPSLFGAAPRGDAREPVVEVILPWSLTGAKSQFSEMA